MLRWWQALALRIFAPPNAASARWAISTYVGYVGMYDNNIFGKTQPEKSCEHRNAQYKMDNILFNYYCLNTPLWL